MRGFVRLPACCHGLWNGNKSMYEERPWNNVLLYPQQRSVLYDLMLTKVCDELLGGVDILQQPFEELVRKTLLHG